MAGMRSQPQAGQRLNQAHPLARGLVGFWLPMGAGFVSALPGVPPAVLTPNAQFTGDPKGRRLGSNGSLAAYIPGSARTKPTTAISVLMAGALSVGGSLGYTSYLIGCEDYNNGWGIYQVGGLSAQPRPYLRIGDAWADQPANISMSESGQVGFTFDGATFWSVANGARSNSQSVSGSITNSPADIGINSKNAAGQNSGNGAFHYLAMWNRALSPADLASFNANPWQIFDDGQDEWTPALVAADTALSGSAATIASGSGALTTSIRLAGGSTASAAAAGALGTALRLAGAAQGQASAAGVLSSAIQLTGAALASPAAAGALTTAIKLTGTASAVAGALATFAGGGAVLSGAVSAQASATGSLSTGIAIAGMAAASATGAGALASTSPSAEVIDVSKISLARVVIFEGSGSRVVPFEGSGSRVVPFEGSGSRIVVFEGSGERVRIESMAVSAKAPTKVGDKWFTDRDPDEKSYYLADITQELIDRATTAVSVELVLVGVVQLEVPTIQTATKDSVQRTYAVAFLGGTDSDPPEGWKWVARVTCANGERFDKTTWFNKVDP